MEAASGGGLPASTVLTNDASKDAATAAPGGGMGNTQGGIIASTSQNVREPLGGLRNYEEQVHTFTHRFPVQMGNPATEQQVGSGNVGWQVRTAGEDSSPGNDEGCSYYEWEGGYHRVPDGFLAFYMRKDEWIDAVCMADEFQIVGGQWEISNVSSIDYFTDEALVPPVKWIPPIWNKFEGIEDDGTLTSQGIYRWHSGPQVSSLTFVPDTNQQADYLEMWRWGMSDLGAGAIATELHQGLTPILYIQQMALALRARILPRFNPTISAEYNYFDFPDNPDEPVKASLMNQGANINPPREIETAEIGFEFTPDENSGVLAGHDNINSRWYAADEQPQINSILGTAQGASQRDGLAWWKTPLHWFRKDNNVLSFPTGPNMDDDWKTSTEADSVLLFKPKQFPQIETASAHTHYAVGEITTTFTIKTRRYTGLRLPARLFTATAGTSEYGSYNNLYRNTPGATAAQQHAVGMFFNKKATIWHNPNRRRYKKRVLSDEMTSHPFIQKTPPGVLYGEPRQILRNIPAQQATAFEPLVMPTPIVRRSDRIKKVSPSLSKKK